MKTSNTIYCGRRPFSTPRSLTAVPYQRLIVYVYQTIRRMPWSYGLRSFLEHNVIVHFAGTRPTIIYQGEQVSYF